MLFKLDTIEQIKKAIETAPGIKYNNCVFDLPDDYNFNYLFDENIYQKVTSNEWPLAVDPILLKDTNSDEVQAERANLILDNVLVENLTNKKFLDFGCGNGFTTEMSMLRSPKIAVGYDIVKDESWAKHKNAIFTTDRGEVDRHAPYDVIMAYDVFDHIMDGSQVDTLKYLNSISNGIIFVRFHPWSCQTGTHLYNTLNKAYAQFFLSEQELIKYGHKITPTYKVLHPRMQYFKWIREAGLRTVSLDINTQGLDEWFFSPDISKMILTHYGNTMGPNFPVENLSSQFWDYVLIKRT